MLDLGCGTGFPLLELAERLGPGTSVIGLDPWHEALRRARTKRDIWPVTGVEVVRGDGASMPFRESSFDLVVSNLGVNNFDDVDAALAECRRVLRLGGIFPCGSLWSQPSECSRWLPRWRAPPHPHRGRH